MDNEPILFFGEFTNFSVASFMIRMQQAKREKLDVRIECNSLGGDPDAGFGLVKTIRDYPYKNSMMVYGAAYSFMAYALLYSDDVSCLEQSTFLFHRAASFMIEDEQIPAMRRLLVEKNNSLRKAMEEKLDVAAFERISGVTLDQLFSMDDRIDVVFNAEEALEIGLVKKVVPLSANEARDINQMMLAASHGHGIQKLQVSNEMKNLSELKEKDPEGYKKLMAEAVLEAKKGQEKEQEKKPNPATFVTVESLTAEQAVDAERERVKEWNVFAEIDPKKVKEGIESGKKITDSERSEFLLQTYKTGFAKRLEEAGGAPVVTGPSGADATPEDKNLQSLEAGLRKGLGLEATNNPIISTVEKRVVA